MSGTEVIVLRSTDTGAPVLKGTGGALIDLFDACLVDGYNSNNIQGITRTGSTATVTFAAAHGLNTDGVTKVLHSGLDQTEYNGIFLPFNITPTSYDITVTGTPATPATGTGVSKIAPLGWEKAFSGTNKAAYRSLEPTSTKMYLRVDDNNPSADTNKTARVVGCEVMSSIDAYSALFPTTAQLATGIFIQKSSTSDTVSRPWTLIGDGFEFFLFMANNNSTSGVHRIFHFGDPASEMASDPYGCLIMGCYAAAAASAPEVSTTVQLIASNTGSITSNWQNGHYFARNYTQLGSSSVAGKQGNMGLGGSVIGYSGVIPYPAPQNNGLYITPLLLIDNAVLRAQFKGAYQPLHTRPLGHGTVLPADKSPIGRRIMGITTPYSSSTGGEYIMDIDGPWR